MLENREGHRVPKTEFKQIREGQLTGRPGQEIFEGRTVVAFALPGAFTPTCSATHLPRYNELAEVFRENGVDEVVCISVNDAFVMDAWGRQQRAGNVTLLADGNGDFTEAMGMLVDKSDLGFGKRSWRYSMLVRDGLIEKMFIEPEKPGDPFEVSDADTMLEYINPSARKPANVSIITRPGCPFCAKTKELLRAKGMGYEEIVLGREVSETTVRAITGRDSVPQIFIDGKHIGGSDDLEKYLA